jgi:hypothetical protein
MLHRQISGSLDLRTAVTVCFINRKTKCASERQLSKIIKHKVAVILDEIFSSSSLYYTASTVHVEHLYLLPNLYHCSIIVKTDNP